MAKRKSKTRKPLTAVSPAKSKSVEMRRIQNGYVISTWTEKGQKERFAKTLKEAKVLAGKFF